MQAGSQQMQLSARARKALAGRLRALTPVAAAGGGLRAGMLRAAALVPLPVLSSLCFQKASRREAKKSWPGA